jgi:lysophospholipase L1-like esterase
VNDTTWAEMPHAAVGRPRGRGTRIARVVVPFIIGGLLVVLGLPIAGALVVVAACVLVALTVFAPAAARRVEHVFERVGHWAGHLVGVVLLGLVNLLVFTPVAFLMWVFRYDPLAPGVPKDAASFWHAHAGRSLPKQPFADERSLFVPAGAVGYRRSRPVLRLATALGVVVLLLLADLGAGWVYDQVASSTRGTAAVADDSYDADAQPAFGDAPWAADLLQEQTEIPAVRDPYLGYRVDDMTGRYTNFVDGARVSYQPATDGRKLVVWFFGASALFGAGQRDGYTIPSQFARIVEAADIPVEVRNFGRPATSSWQELELLEQIVGRGEKPDFVVFYDGFNDLNTQINIMLSTVPVDIFDPSAAGVADAAAKEQITVDTDAAAREAAQRAASTSVASAPSGFDAVVDAYWDQAASRRVYDALDDLLNGSDAPRTEFVPGVEQQRADDAPATDEIVQAAANAVDLQGHAAELATAIAAGQGAEAAFYWQPFVFTKKLLPEEEAYTRFSSYEPERWLPAMREVRARLAQTPYVDLGAALDPATEPVLWDFVHTNEEGARLSAQAIFADLRARLEQRLAESS